jgi:hypothetical protein
MPWYSAGLQRSTAELADPSKVTAWRDGRLVVHPDAERADCTVWLSVADGSGPELGWEGMLARRVGTDRARVCAMPFWIYDLNLGDEVALIESAETALVVTAVVRDARNYGFRVIPAEDAKEHWWRELMIELERFECWFDIRTSRFVALSAPPDHAGSVADLLARHESRGDWQFETSRTRDPDD